MNTWGIKEVLKFTIKNCTKFLTSNYIFVCLCQILMLSYFSTFSVISFRLRINKINFCFMKNLHGFFVFNIFCDETFIDVDTKNWFHWPGVTLHSIVENFFLKSQFLWFFYEIKNSTTDKTAILIILSILKLISFYHNAWSIN